MTFSRRQNEILDALSAIVCVEGFADLTVADLADRLRCSRRTLYTLANSRDELVLGVVRRLFDRWLQQARSGAEAAGGGAASIVAFLSERLTGCEAGRRFFDDVAATPEALDAYVAYRSACLDDLRRLVADGVASGVLRTDDVCAAAEVLDASVRRLRQLLHRTPPEISVEGAQALLDDLVRHWLGQPAP